MGTLERCVPSNPVPVYPDSIGHAGRDAYPVTLSPSAYLTQLGMLEPMHTW
jgi:hypothetical protein